MTYEAYNVEGTSHQHFKSSLGLQQNQKHICTMFSLIFLTALYLVGPSFCAPKDPVFKLTDADFDHFLKDKDAMLVDFYAPW